jgi:hypothetical protein
MNQVADDIQQILADAVARLESVPLDSSRYRAIRDESLLELNRAAGRARELVSALSAVIAGEIAHRSAPALGAAGLSQRTGFRTTEELLKSTTRASGREAVTAVRVGRVVREMDGRSDPATGEVLPATQPWLAPAAHALVAGAISAEALDAIRSGIGAPSPAITSAQLEQGVESLVRLAADLDVDRLFKRARFLRDELDADGVAAREEERRQQRSLRLAVLPSGMGRLVWTMHGEALATVKELYDRMTSPKLGGVRFVSGEFAERADSIIRDDRTPEQLASDGFEQLLRLGADADPRFLIGSGAPSVAVVTTSAAIHSGEGFGRIEGQVDAVALTTVDRLTCDGSTTAVVIDSSGQPLDLGREQRLFSRRQRRALALRDGGCRTPGCDRPPSWTEAHHIQHWGRDRGATDLANGILLCKHHHLLFHNNGWEIERDEESRYWLIPPENIDPSRRRRAMPTKSLLMGVADGTQHPLRANRP